MKGWYPELEDAVCPNCDLIEKEVERLRESEKFFADRCGDAELKLLELQRKSDLLLTAANHWQDKYEALVEATQFFVDGLYMQGCERLALLEDDDEQT